MTFDTGALVALERYRRGMTRVVEAALQARVSITVPSNAIAEWWRGPTDRRDYVRRMLVIQEVNETLAKLAGEALAWLKPRSVRIDDTVTIDATVMATAALYGPNLRRAAGGRERLERPAKGEDEEAIEARLCTRAGGHASVPAGDGQAGSPAAHRGDPR